MYHLGLRRRVCGLAKESVHPITQRVHVPNNWVLGIWVIVIIVQVLGEHMMIRYLDPYGYNKGPSNYQYDGPSVLACSSVGFYITPCSGMSKHREVPSNTASLSERRADFDCERLCG